MWPKIGHVMPGLPQPLDERSFQLKRGMIGSNRNAHMDACTPDWIDLENRP
jgi:hypothetical protein